MGIQVETVSTGRLTLRYFRFGHGPRTMVILPGLSVQSVMEAADAVAEAYQILEEDFTLWVFDRREDLTAAYSPREMARDTAEAFQKLGLRDVDLFGVSLGGMAAQILAIEHPELVRALALGSTAARVKEPLQNRLEEWISLAEQKDPVGLYLSFGQMLYPPDVFRQYRDLMAAAGQTVTEAELIRFIYQAEGARDFDAADELEKLRCPVLVIGDTEDAVLGPEAVPELIEKLSGRPGFASYMYTGFGHAAYDTAPDYKERLRRFFTAQR